MKKFFSVILVLLLCAPLVGCGGLKGGDTGLSRTWNAADDPGDVYGNAGENVWIASPIGSSQAYFDSVIMSHTEDLGVGLYEFSAKISIDNNKYTSARPVVMLRAVSDGETLAQKELYQFDFSEAGSLLEFSLPFEVQTGGEIDLEILWMNGATVTVGDCEVSGIPAEQYLVDDLCGYLYEGFEELTLDKNNLYFLDLYELMMPLRNSVSGYDLGLLVSALQGLVNREESLLFIRFNEPNNLQGNQDEYWLSYLMEEGNYLAGKNLVRIDSVATALWLFKDYVSGLVLWDEEVPATVNVACTAAGVENLLPVRYLEGKQTVYGFLKEFFDFEVKLNLEGKFRDQAASIPDTDLASTGSAKNDAYLWAKAKYLDTGKTNPTLLAYHLDAFSWDKTGVSVTYYELQSVFLANKDYYIKNKAFFLDLYVFDDMAPNDDPNQIVGTDYNTLIAILEKQNELAGGQIVEFGGFVPWYIKYTASAGIGTEGMPDAVAAEWQLSRLLGTYYMVKDADAYAWTSIANCSIYSSVPAKGNRTQPNAEKITEEKLAERAEQYLIRTGDGQIAGIKPNNYIMLYMGDYDSAAWMLTNMRNNFQDANLGFVPMAWPVNFGPKNRIPFIYDYMYDHASENCYFIGDHNGYGYLELATLADPDRPSGLNGSFDDFLELTRTWWDQYDLSIQGFLINTTANIYQDAWPYSEEIMRKYSDLAVDGIVVNAVTVQMGDSVNVKNSEGDEVPWSRSISMSNAASLEQCVQTLMDNFPTNSTVRFCQVRSICNMPTFLKQVFERAEQNGVDLEVLDPYTYFYLLRIHNSISGFIY